MIKLVKVTGNSMSPTLEDGDYVMTKKPRRLAPGLIYVINHSELGRIVKRLGDTKHDRCFFIGDNPSSTPSTIIGAVEQARVVGQVILVIGKSGLRRVSTQINKHS